MATKIPLGTPAYFTAFETGQGLGFSNYFTYAPDHSTNYKLLRLTINQMIDEISAVGGVNAIAALDVILWDDAANPLTAPAQTYGVVGASSYEVTVNAGDLDIKKGVAFIGGNRVQMVSDLLGVTSSGGAGTRWVALDANGQVFIEAAAGGQLLDIASVTWDGAIFTGTPTQLADIFFDGDAWAEMQNRAAAGTSFPATVFRSPHSRVEEIEQSLSAAAGGAAVLAMPPGTVALPGVVFSDGAGAADTTSGWYRVAANVWAFAASAAAVLRLAAQGIGAAINGAAGTPFLYRTSDTNTGLYFPAADEVALAGGGEKAVVGASIARGGTALPNLLRCKASNIGAAQTLTTGVWQVVNLNTSPDSFDVGGWHDPLGANPDRFTCPTNGDGLYRVTAHASHATTATPGNTRAVRVTLNGTFVPESVVMVLANFGAGAQKTELVSVCEIQLVATDIVRVEAREAQSGTNLDVECTLTVVRLV